MATHLRLVPTPSSARDAQASGEAPLPTPIQRALVESALPMVDQCARALAHRYRDIVTHGELLAAGTIAAHDAAAIYEEDKHPDFSVFARHFIRGQMMDAIAAERFSLRARVERAMERAFEQMASHATLEINLFMAEDEAVEANAREGKARALASAFLAGVLEVHAQSAEELAIEAEAKQAAIGTLAQAIGALYPHEREVIRLVYEQGLTLDKAARALSVHLNTVKGRHRSALVKLRAAFVEGEAGRRLWPSGKEGRSSR
jgi:RNA polymerase sigma factor (sigma-70 family)